MPDRILRDELLTSDRWLRLGGKDTETGNARRLAFIACISTADALGNMEAASTGLERLWRGFGIGDDAAIEATLADFVRVDLARLYQDETGKRYLHLPRYGQRLRYLGRLCPLSPWTTDEQKHEITKKSPGALQAITGRAPGEHQAGTGESPARTGRAPAEVDVEVKRRDVEVKQTGSDYARATHIGTVIDPTGLNVKTRGPEGPNPNGNGQHPPAADDWWVTSHGIADKGRELGLTPEYRETDRAFKARIFKALQQRKPTP